MNSIIKSNRSLFDFSLLPFHPAAIEFKYEKDRLQATFLDQVCSFTVVLPFT